MDSYFQEGVTLKGVLRSKGVVHMEGNMEGEIFSSSHLIVGKGGNVKGDIESYDITNMGSIKGNINAKNKVSLMDDSHLDGDIATYQLIVEEGSNFEGKCKMLGKAPSEKKTPKSPEKKNGKGNDPSWESLQQNLDQIGLPQKDSKADKKEPETASAPKKSFLPRILTKLTMLVLGVAVLAMIGLNLPFSPDEDVGGFLSKGRELIKNKKYADAESVLNEGIKQIRDNPELHLELGNVYLLKKNFKKALVQFQRSLEINPSKEAYRLKLSEALLGLGQLQEAEKNLNEIIEKNSNSFNAHYGLGLLKIKAGKNQEGIAAFQQASKIDPDNFSVHQKLLEIFRSEGNYSDSIREMEEMVRLKPEEPGLRLTLGEMYFKNNNSKKAAEQFQKVLKLHPDNHLAQLRVADWYYEGKKYDKALKLYEIALKKNPENSDIQVKLGKIFLLKNDKTNAELAFRKAEKSKTKNKEAYFELGKILTSDLKYDEGQEQFEKAIALDPNYGDAHYELGKIFEINEKIGDALQSYEKAVEFESKNTEYIFSLGKTYIEEKKFDNAVKVLKTGVKLEPQNGNLIFQLCRAYRKKGYYSIAIKHCEKALKIIPESDAVNNRLAWLYAKKQRKLKKALKMARKLVIKYPDNAGYIDTLSEVYYSMGNVDRAIKNMETALNISPETRYYKQQMWRFKHIKPKALKSKKTQKPVVKTVENTAGAEKESVSEPSPVKPASPPSENEAAVIPQPTSDTPKVLEEDSLETASETRIN